jgi:hypothetical protein
MTEDMKALILAIARALAAEGSPIPTEQRSEIAKALVKVEDAGG